MSSRQVDQGADMEVGRGASTKPAEVGYGGDLGGMEGRPYTRSKADALRMLTFTRKNSLVPASVI